MKYKVTIFTFNPYNETRLIELEERDANNGTKTEYRIIKDGQVLSALYHYVFYERSNWMTIPVTEEIQNNFTLGILYKKGLQQVPLGELDLSKYDYLTSMVFISTAKVDLTPQLEESLWKILYVYQQLGYEQAMALAKRELGYDETEAMMLVIAQYFLGDIERLIEESMPQYAWEKGKLLALAEKLAKQDKESATTEVDEFVIPKAVTGVSQNVVPYKTKRVVLHDGITTIRSWAFRTCVVGELIMPDSVTNIQDEAFFGSAVVKLKISNGLKSIGKQAFYKAYIGQELVLADGLESIGQEAFIGCSLGKVVLPKSVKYIGWDAFAKCGNLTDVTMPSNFTSAPSSYSSNKIQINVKEEFDKLKNIFGENYKNIKFTFLD